MQCSTDPFEHTLSLSDIIRYSLPYCSLVIYTIIFIFVFEFAMIPFVLVLLNNPKYYHCSKYDIIQTEEEGQTKILLTIRIHNETCFIICFYPLTLSTIFSSENLFKTALHHVLTGSDLLFFIFFTWRCPTNIITWGSRFNVTACDYWNRRLSRRQIDAAVGLICILDFQSHD